MHNQHIESTSTMTENWSPPHTHTHTHNTKLTFDTLLWTWGVESHTDNQVSKRQYILCSISHVYLVRYSSAVRRLFVRCYTRLLHDFPFDHLISPFHFHVRTYKRDLAILTEWWHQCIAWWELLNAARQIICIHVSAMFIREITIIYANHLPWYITVIVIFSKSRDKCLKVKVKWRNERV